ncbi:uncharacterized protein DUF2336 [Bradyrhizobium sp. R2.2-H]|jgi:hypothetical protein|uniref:DUF2336 domain-containing protein n=1 Tax=unclassified Bradyrhizobium TaxID=2631580 RepID=UPI00104C24AB|nr:MULTISPECIES: DUF2336 domain-containing protein [unclassified Bradyrhizobium]TCU74827.1 uncharacterized protein DUF2336 [Bradyrhizobium sp. Y-H1]TCU77595.1 uncharacterized protein DUF2336 [Bradyrhizobium sp. R2.2-H]
MTANSPADVLVELEDAVATCPLDRCARILSGIMQLLTSSRDRPQELLANVVDGVLLRLTERVEASALIELSTALAELAVAPPKTMRRLASHHDPEVACPVLLRSPSLSTADLKSIAASSGERQQRAIAARAPIDPPVIETLIEGGSRGVCIALIANTDARFSDAAYAALVGKCLTDDELTKALALRPDTPDTVMRKLLSAAPASGTGPKATVSLQAVAAAPIVPKLPCAAAYASARPEIVALNRIGKLNDSTVNRFAIRGETANLVTALSVLSGTPIEIVEHVMTDDDCEGLVMACRASRLNWQTTLAILGNRCGRRLSFAERERAQHTFETLLLSTSQWTVRWGEIAASARESSREHRGAKMGISR